MDGLAGFLAGVGQVGNEAGLRRLGHLKLVLLLLQRLAESGQFGFLVLKSLAQLSLSLLMLLQPGSQLLQLELGLRLPFRQLVAVAPQGLQLGLGSLQLLGQCLDLRGSPILLRSELLLQLLNALLGSPVLLGSLLDLSRQLGFQLGNALLLLLLAGLRLNELLSLPLQLRF